jgi:hypothetical protein
MGAELVRLTEERKKLDFGYELKTLLVALLLGIPSRRDQLL